MEKINCSICNMEIDIREAFLNKHKNLFCEDCYRELEENSKRSLQDIRESADTE